MIGAFGEKLVLFTSIFTKTSEHRIKGHNQQKMSHLSDIDKSLKIGWTKVTDVSEWLLDSATYSDVLMIILPSYQDPNSCARCLNSIINKAVKSLSDQATLVVVGEIIDLVHSHTFLQEHLIYQHWVSVKRSHLVEHQVKSRLPSHHFGAVIYTRYKGTLRHSLTRVQYTYCPECDKTTKDYGGKKNSYHKDGTLISDVWRDINCDLHGDLEPLITRFADLFSLKPYQELSIIDFRLCAIESDKHIPLTYLEVRYVEPDTVYSNLLHQGDCLEKLAKIPDNSIDFAFVDPPYNLSKRYNNYSDDLSLTEYFQWCDRWIDELTRVLRPGRTLAILNVPFRAIRHFTCLETQLLFQNWIVWDALSVPGRKIMPANYPILCFSKGEPRELPGLVDFTGNFCLPESAKTFEALRPLDELYCRRPDCVNQRRVNGADDRGVLSDLWWDIHRLKHNTQRVDHPTQLPPELLYRLISIFTTYNEVVLDCFNATGTTTLTAHQLGRKYIGVEQSHKYHTIALKRHEEILNSINPFRTEKRPLTEKNNNIQRLGILKYEVPKNKLQLEVRIIAERLNRMPSKQEIASHSKYPIEYFEQYFSSWGEVYAAARTTGMVETRNSKEDSQITISQLSLFED